ncbi:MAG: UbiA family prenyltransferase [Spirochaetia bacterium]|nr:UbiA family prenyltransferase [Spirochaetia bacterium]
MTLQQFNRIVEIRTKIISMGTFISGSLYALVVTGSWSWTRFLLMWLSVLFIDMGTTGFNSYYDYIRGTDNADYNLERDKVLVHEGVPPILALLISLALFAAAGILGLVLAISTSIYLIPVGALCMLVGYTYTGGPYPISRTPFGELFAGGFLGSVLFMISFYVQSLSISMEIFLASIPFLLLIALILTVNNTCDRVADSAAGRRTLSIIFSGRVIRALMLLMIIIAYLLPFIYSAVGLYPAASIIFMIPAALLSLFTYRAMVRQGFSLETKGLSMGGVSKIFLLYTLAFSLAMITALL